MSGNDAESQFTTAKLFKHGRSQAVRLPKAFRFPGQEVRIRRLGDRVILEPLVTPPFDVDAWLAELARFAGVDFPDIATEAPVEPDTTVDLD